MPVWEYKCNRCGQVFERLFHKNPPINIRCERDGCAGYGQRIMSVFQGPDQMRGKVMLEGGRKYNKRRREWRSKVDEGRVEPPPR